MSEAATDTIVAGLREFVALSKEKRRLEEQVKSLTTRLGEMSDLLVEDMALNGVQNATVDGAKLYIRSDHYCNKRGGVSMEVLCDVLRKTDLGYLVAETYNASALKARIREMRDQGVPVPEVLADVLSIGEVQRLVATGLGD